MTKLIVAFRNFAKALNKNLSLLKIKSKGEENIITSIDSSSPLSMAQQPLVGQGLLIT
jgi:hypothetical protein